MILKNYLRTLPGFQFLSDTDVEHVGAAMRVDESGEQVRELDDPLRLVGDADGEDEGVVVCGLRAVAELEERLAEDGSLVVSGHDIGEAAQVMGRYDYEYMKTLAPSTVPLVLEALGEDPATDVMEVIAARWCGDDESFEFERRIREADVPYDFWSY